MTTVRYKWRIKDIIIAILLILVFIFATIMKKQEIQAKIGVPLPPNRSQKWPGSS